MTTDSESRTWALPAFAADLAFIALFAAVGRRNHAEGLSIGGVAETAWPFLAGAVVGWLISRAWRRPTAVVPTGITIWVCAVAVGMLLRKATSEGTAASFVTVATLTIGLLLLGWRAAVTRVSGRRR
jgi:peptidoglycan/LPS O-acetylase OafA/YrhL